MNEPKLDLSHCKAEAEPLATRKSGRRRGNAKNHAKLARGVIERSQFFRD